MTANPESAGRPPADLPRVSMLGPGYKRAMPVPVAAKCGYCGRMGMTFRGWCVPCMMRAVYTLREVAQPLGQFLIAQGKMIVGQRLPYGNDLRQLLEECVDESKEKDRVRPLPKTVLPYGETTEAVPGCCESREGGRPPAEQPETKEQDAVPQDGIPDETGLEGLERSAHVLGADGSPSPVHVGG